MGSIVTLADVRAFIARRLLNSDGSPDEVRIGSITLRPHQLSAVDRLKSAIAEFGGALLCDQVGMGKTFVALALCEDGGVDVVAPAVLKDMWQSAAESAGMRIDFTSTESLSRAGTSKSPTPAGSASTRILIVDEAHHFRNPRTKRYAALARLAARRRVVLLTATPVHNRRKDLTALFSLFIGSDSETLTRSELGRLIIRRENSVLGAIAGFPEIEPPQWCEVRHCDDVPRLLLDLPPPLPPRDGGDGGTLLIHSLLRQWSSSDATLERALTRRLQRSFAMVSALESGTYPSQAELSAWSSAEDCVQLAFAKLVASGSSSTEALLPVVRAHRDAISGILRTIKSRSGTDSERSGIVRTIRKKHHGLGVVAFSQYANTVDALFRDLARDGGVAALTGDGARVAGGRITRREAIGRFAPVASGVRTPKAADSVTLLLTTDLLSEGVNLQDACVVIHLDLPWTPARMEQRLGRVARMGSRHDRVFSYVIRPPASTETLIHLERVLRDKVNESSHVVDVFPSLSLVANEETSSNTPRLSESVRSTLEVWSQQSRRVGTDEGCAAAVTAQFDGFLALCEVEGKPSLIAGDADGASDDPQRIVAVMRHCMGKEVQVDPDVMNGTVRTIQRYFDGLRITDGARTSANAHVRRACLKRIARIVSSARPHERMHVASLASRARSSLLSRIGVDGERRLESLLDENLADDLWMQRVSELGNDTPTGMDREIVIATIVFVTHHDTKP